MQPWTAVYIPSIAIVFLVLLRVLRIRATDARNSRNYYALTLLFVLAWMVVSMLMQNLAEQYAVAADFLGKLGSVFTSVAVLFFVVSTIYFTRAPNLAEELLVGSPLLVILIAIALDSFETKFMSYWWLGQISNPALNYFSTTLTVGVILYGLGRLALLRSKIRSPDVRRRLTFLFTSLLVALASSLFLYLLTPALDLPPLSPLVVGLSILISYPAFSPGPVRIGSGST